MSVCTCGTLYLLVWLDDHVIPPQVDPSPNGAHPLSTNWKERNIGGTMVWRATCVQFNCQ
jgi:hypothetical protein